MWNSKPKKSRCNCRGKTHGNPKIGNGPCRYGVRDAVVERIAGKRLVRRWLAAKRQDVDE
jgi:hypothetical protein